METEHRLHRSRNRFPVAQGRDGKTHAIQIKSPDGSVAAVLLPKDTSAEGAQKISDFLEEHVGALVTAGYE